MLRMLTNATWFCLLWFIYHATSSSLSNLVPQWTQLGRAPSHEEVELRFALKHRNSELLEGILFNVSDPRSSHFGQHWSRDEMMELLNEQHGVDNIRYWLQHQHGITSDQISVSGFADFVIATVSVLQAEQMLEHPCYMFQHSLNSQLTHISAKSPQANSSGLTHTSGVHEGLPRAIPTHIKNILAFVSGVAELPDPQALLAHTKAFLRSTTRPGLSDPGHQQLRLSGSEQKEKKPENESSYPAYQPFGDTISSDVSVFTSDQQVYLYVPLLCNDDTRATEDDDGIWSCPDDGALEYIHVSFTPQGGDMNWVTVTPDTMHINTYDVEVTVFIMVENFVPYTYEINVVYSEETVELSFPWVTVSAPEVIPDHIKGFYGSTDYIATHPDNVQAIASLYLSTINAGFFSVSDLRDFYKATNVSTDNLDLVSWRCTSDDCDNDPDRPDQETNLDVQLITALGPGVRTLVYHSQHSHFFIEDVLANIQSDPDPPKVLSISYGASESAYASSGYLSYANDLLAALGTMGVTIVVASGDQGAYMHGSECANGFEPVFPASSPYVLSVGATQLVAADGGGCPYETAASLDWGAMVTGGGGFSESFTRPYWQTAAEEYIDPDGDCKHKLPPRDMWNASNRGYPDLAFFGHSVKMLHFGRAQLVDGTSASAPALAGWLSLVNDHRLALKKPTLGFVNPLLYSLQENHSHSHDHKHEIFFDLKDGANNCLDTYCCTHGFSSCAGWDAVTGLGSPRLDRLAHYLVPGGMTGNKMAVPDNLNCVHIEKTVIWTPMIIFLTSISMLFTLACMSWWCYDCCLPYYRRIKGYYTADTTVVDMLERYPEYDDPNNPASLLTADLLASHNGPDSEHHMTVAEGIAMLRDNDSFDSDLPSTPDSGPPLSDLSDDDETTEAFSLVVNRPARTPSLFENFESLREDEGLLSDSTAIQQPRLSTPSSRRFQLDLDRLEQVEKYERDPATRKTQSKRWKKNKKSIDKIVGNNREPKPSLSNVQILKGAILGAPRKANEISDIPLPPSVITDQVSDSDEEGLI